MVFILNCYLHFDFVNTTLTMIWFQATYFWSYLLVYCIHSVSQKFRDGQSVMLEMNIFQFVNFDYWVFKLKCTIWRTKINIASLLYLQIRENGNLCIFFKISIKEIFKKKKIVLNKMYGVCYVVLEKKKTVWKNIKN